MTILNAKLVSFVRRIYIAYYDHMLDLKDDINLLVLKLKIKPFISF